MGKEEKSMAGAGTGGSLLSRVWTVCNKVQQNLNMEEKNMLGFSISNAS